MIIAAYPGVGKTWLAQNRANVIDLDSSSFKLNGQRFPAWEKVYVQVACSLNTESNIVCVSTHSEVLDELAKCKEQIFLCYPELSLKDAWIERLDMRYQKSKSDKDRLALKRVTNNFETDIQELKHRSGFLHLTILDKDTYLGNLIQERKVCK